MIDIELKICPNCKLPKVLEEFGLAGKKLSRYNSWCKKCDAAKKLAYHHKMMLDPDYREKRRMKSLNDRYMGAYGITYQDKLDMFKNQNGLCEICKKEMSMPNKCSVDHDHQTGKIRGLLCPKCNTGLGYIESTNFLKLALEYKKKYEN